jgi:hypothetical protein
MELTFEVVCGLEPQLKKLHDEIRNRPRTEWDDVMHIGAEEYKDRMKALVGWHRENKEVGDRRLRTSEAYDTAYFALLDALNERLL